jgi:hypothetical protein
VGPFREALEGDHDLVLPARCRLLRIEPARIPRRSQQASASSPSPSRRARSSQDLASSAVPTKLRRRTCASESRPPEKAAATAGHSRRIRAMWTSSMAPT